MIALLVFLCKGRQYFIAIDNVPVFEVATQEITLALLGVHFVFNIAYPIGLEPVFTLLEFIYLNKSPGKQGNTFSRVFAELNSA